MIYITEEVNASLVCPQALDGTSDAVEVCEVQLDPLDLILLQVWEQFTQLLQCPVTRLLRSCSEVHFSALGGEIFDDVES